MKFLDRWYGVVGTLNCSVGIWHMDVEANIIAIPHFFFVMTKFDIHSSGSYESRGPSMMSLSNKSSRCLSTLSWYVYQWIDWYCCTTGLTYGSILKSISSPLNTFKQVLKIISDSLCAFQGRVGDSVNRVPSGLI